MLTYTGILLQHLLKPNAEKRPTGEVCCLLAAAIAHHDIGKQTGDFKCQLPPSLAAKLTGVGFGVWRPFFILNVILLYFGQIQHTIE